MDEEFAEAVILPENDPTEQAEQVRLQQLELLALTQGQPVPISPRDNHLVHLEFLQGPIQAAAQSAVEDATTLPLLVNLGVHAEEHLLSAEAAGVDGKVLEPFYNMVTSAKNAAKQLEDQAAALASQGLDPNGNLLADPAMAGDPAMVDPASMAGPAPML
jgi:hypothetical protein